MPMPCQPRGPCEPLGPGGPVDPVTPGIRVVGVIIKVLIPSVIVTKGTMIPGPMASTFVLKAMNPSTILLLISKKKSKN
jgi:hypothetical protein